MKALPSCSHTRRSVRSPTSLLEVAKRFTTRRGPPNSSAARRRRMSSTLNLAAASRPMARRSGVALRSDALGGQRGGRRVRSPCTNELRRRSTSNPRSSQFDNGLGGFLAAGDEYVIRLRPDADGRLQLPPLPWSHVVANPQAGFIATETGAGYTWTVNSRENRLTHWSQRPRLRSALRSALPARPRPPGLLVADAGPGRAQRRARGSLRVRVRRVSTDERRASAARAKCSCRSDDPVKIMRAVA